MTSPAPPPDPAFDEVWKTLADSVAGLDPGETITERVHERATVRVRPPHAATASGGDPPKDTPFTIPSLPFIAVANIEARPADPGGADLSVTGVLGEGGMGVVLLAHQRSLHREVALKVLKPGNTKESARTALLTEAIITGSLEHPSVVPVHALGHDAEGQPILVMKRIEGASWRDLARDRDHPLWSAVAPEGDDRLDAHLEILMAVCNAVHFAHSRGFVHRDLKLHNVMIGGFGEVYVLDWGIATRAAVPGTVGPLPCPLVGTPSYMAPEMVWSDLARIDARTDVYLLGATLHALLTGGPRHRGESLYDVLFSAGASLPFDYGPDVPGELAAICNKATSAKPADRFPTALALRRAIASFRRHRGSIALSDEAAARLAELRALLAAPAKSAAPANARRVHGLLTECRFGFMQALRAWEDNEAARDGLTSCLEMMIEHEIAQRDAEGARALYAELPGPAAKLERQIEALEADLGEVAAREARLRAMERDQDLSIGAGTQFSVVGILMVCAVGISILNFRDGFSVPSHRETIASTAGIFGLLLLGAALAWKRLRTAISRRAIAVLVLLPASLLGHRILATLQGTSVTSMLAVDLWIAAVVASTGAITLLPWMGWGAFVSILGATAATRWPERGPAIFNATVLVGLIFPSLLGRRLLRK